METWLRLAPANASCEGGESHSGAFLSAELLTRKHVLYTVLLMSEEPQKTAISDVAWQYRRCFPVLSDGSMMSCRCLLVLVWLAVSGCGGDGSGSSPAARPRPQPVVNNPPATGAVITFSKVSDIGLDRPYTAGLDAQRIRFFSGGVAAADVDGNGFVDLLLVGGNSEPNHFYANEGGALTEIGADLGLDLVHWASGPAFGDIDGDGDLDLFIGGIEGDSVSLFENQSGQFVDITLTSRIILTAETTVSATFYDYDRDGYLDLFLTHWGTRRYIREDTETVWRNNGDLTFTNTSIESGIANNLIESDTDWSYTPNFSDIDNDGDGDLLMASDFEESQVYRNNDDGTFTRITDRDVIKDQSGMGAAVGDYDNDGDMDWFVTSIYNLDDVGGVHFGNRLYRNDGAGTFSDITDHSGVDDGGWGWGACAADFDNDGRLDIFHVNGWVDGPFGDFTADQVRFYHAMESGVFRERATMVGLNDIGQGRGVACFDVERDGDVDIFITNNSSEHLVLYQNDSENDNHYLSVRLTGAGTNTFGIGAHIAAVVPDGGRQVREMGGSNNYVSHNPYEVHFGLGEATEADVTVTWPDGSVSLQTAQADQQISIPHPNAP